MDLIWLVWLGTSIWVLYDANSIGVRKGLIKGAFDMGPWGWFFGCLILWIVFFPVYLATRPKITSSTIRSSLSQTLGRELSSSLMCPKCNSNNLPESKYCINCGTELNRFIERHCQKCSTINSSSAKYCSRCGNILS